MAQYSVTNNSGGGVAFTLTEGIRTVMPNETDVVLDTAESISAARRKELEAMGIIIKPVGKPKKSKKNG